MKVVMEFIPESEQVLDITLRPFSLHSRFGERSTVGLLKSETPNNKRWEFIILTISGAITTTRYATGKFLLRALGQKVKRYT